MDTETDSSLMQLVQRGDTEPLAELFERHHVALYRYLLGLSGNRALSEDLVQDVFVRSLKYARTYDPGQSFSAWIYRLARNVYIDAGKKHRFEVPASDAREIRSAEPMPEEWFTREQDLATLQLALQHLPIEKREVLMLSRFHDLRYEDIGRILDCEPGTVKVRVYRALQELRAIFCNLQGVRAQ